MEAKSDKASFRALSSSPSFSTPTLHTSPLSSFFFTSPRRLLIPPTPQQHVHYSHRAPWLRAAVLGANDGLVSTASLMLGVGGGTESLRALVLAGVAGLVAGALSMAVGEYISVSSQRDAEEVRMGRERGYGGERGGGREAGKRRRRRRRRRELFSSSSSPFRPRPRRARKGAQAAARIRIQSTFLSFSYTLSLFFLLQSTARPTSRRSAGSRRRAPRPGPTSSPSWQRSTRGAASARTWRWPSPSS